MHLFKDAPVMVESGCISKMCYRQKGREKNKLFVGNRLERQSSHISMTDLALVNEALR